jgi:uncharacterized membrane protein
VQLCWRHLNFPDKQTNVEYKKQDLKKISLIVFKILFAIHNLIINSFHTLLRHTVAIAGSLLLNKHAATTQGKTRTKNIIRLRTILASRTAV